VTHDSHTCAHWTRARSGTVRIGMVFRHFLDRLESLPALLFWEKSYRYALEAILWDLCNWLLMLASISGQNNASLSGGKEVRHSNHTGTYFFPLWAQHWTKRYIKHRNVQQQKINPTSIKESKRHKPRVSINKCSKRLIHSSTYKIKQ